MNKENTKKLLEDFPDLFSLYNDRGTPFCPMVFGFECGDGWFKLIYELSDKLVKIDPDVRAVQVKEKFGGLRFYIYGYTDEVDKLINEYEDRSYKTCEKCGSEDDVKQTSGWISTLCPSCMKERKKERG